MTAPPTPESALDEEESVYLPPMLGVEFGTLDDGTPEWRPKLADVPSNPAARKRYFVAVALWFACRKLGGTRAGTCHWAGTQKHLLEQAYRASGVTYTGRPANRTRRAKTPAEHFFSDWPNWSKQKSIRATNLSTARARRGVLVAWSEEAHGFVQREDEPDILDEDALEYALGEATKAEEHALAAAELHRHVPALFIFFVASASGPAASDDIVARLVSIKNGAGFGASRSSAPPGQRILDADNADAATRYGQTAAATARHVRETAHLAALANGRVPGADVTNMTQAAAFRMESKRLRLNGCVSAIRAARTRPPPPSLSGRRRPD
eukprot:30666-Pelagococcus_subviridis.AAC.6